MPDWIFADDKHDRTARRSVRGGWFSGIWWNTRFTPSEMVELLEQHGIAVRVLSAAELPDAAMLNAYRITVLVMPYGNAFPKPAFRNLRTFHAACGCLVMNSIPFCHPCDEVNGKWKDLGDARSLGVDYAKSMGTGDFDGDCN